MMASGDGDGLGPGTPRPAAPGAWANGIVWVGGMPGAVGVGGMRPPAASKGAGLG
jgi:hypothetical protein